MRNYMKREDGVITLEACIVVTITLYLILFLYGFIIMFSGQQTMAHALLQSAQSLSMDGYATSKFKEDGVDDVRQILSVFDINTSNEDFSSEKSWYDNPGSNEFKETIKNRFLAYLCDGKKNKAWANDYFETVGIVDKVDDIDFSKCTIDSDDNLILEITYKQKFLFDMRNSLVFPHRMKVKVHMWEH